MQEQLVKFLGYGISGLGLAMALLSFYLLSAEQRLPAPRGTMLRAIYRYMVFSLVLVAFGFAWEYLKPQQGKYAGISAAEEWYDILKASRDKIAGGLQPVSYRRGVLENGKEESMPVEIPSGLCLLYFAMTDKLAEISVDIQKNEKVKVFPLGKDMHQESGRICATDGGPGGQTTIQLKMIKGEGPFVIETYNWTDLGKSN